MDDFESARERVQETTRILRLLNFKLLQLRHTHDQLLAGLQDLLAQLSPPPDVDAPGPGHETDPPA